MSALEGRSVAKRQSWVDLEVQRARNARVARWDLGGVDMPYGWQWLEDPDRELTPKQKAFIECGAIVKGYGGAPGCGKTVALMVDVVTKGLATKGALMAMFRKEFTSAEAAVVKSLRRYTELLNDKYALGIEMSVKTNRADLWFPNGSEMTIRGAKDITRVQGANFDHIFIEEATQLDEDQLGMIFRTHRGEGFTAPIGGGERPVSVSWVSNYAEGWIKDNVVVPYEEGRLQKGWAFFPATFDDIASQPHYKRLAEQGKDFLGDVKSIYAAKYGAEYAENLAAGKWSAAEGLVYPPLIENPARSVWERTVISEREFIENFGGRILGNETCLFGFDHGINHPCGLLTGVVRKTPMGAFLIVTGEWKEALGDRHERVIAEALERTASPIPLGRCRGGWDCHMKVRIGARGKSREEQLLDPRELLLRCGMMGEDLESKDIETGVVTTRRAITAMRVKFIRERTPELRKEYVKYLRAGSRADPGKEHLPPKDAKDDHLMDALRYLVLYAAGNRLVDIEVAAVSREEIVRDVVRGADDVVVDGAQSKKLLTYSAKKPFGVEPTGGIEGHFRRGQPVAPNHRRFTR